MTHKDTIAENLIIRKKNKERVQITRKIAKGVSKITNGYIIDFSEKLVLIHESDDFKIDGYAIIPFEQIKKVRFNNGDRYFDMMLKTESIVDKVGIPYEIDLKNWRSAFKSLLTLGKSVIIECENPAIDTFTIGPIDRIKSRYIHVINFDIEGYLDNEPTIIDYSSITYVAFDREYINIFSKYLRTKDNEA